MIELATAVVVFATAVLTVLNRRATHRVHRDIQTNHGTTTGFKIEQMGESQARQEKLIVGLAEDMAQHKIDDARRFGEILAAVDAR